MPPAISRSEQAKLDELLSDIYRGIEALPDKSLQPSGVSTTAYDISSASNSDNNRSQQVLGGRAYVREYELPGSSALVRQHKQEIAGLREQHNQDAYHQHHHQTAKQPQRSTLKRQTTNEQPQQQQHQQFATVDSTTPQRHHQQPPPQSAQSLGSFLTRATSSATPENKRRVRIVDPQQTSLSPLEASNEYYDQQQRQSPSTNNNNNTRKNKDKVKYVNTNKLIYHQEQNPDDFEQLYAPENSHDSRYQTYQEDELDNELDQENQREEEEDDIDGVTRVEYYHTTWLDRQLGRASKRRSSKELNERQVKEKAMIEELKRSLKNGAITLRQSFKGKKHSNNNSNKQKSQYPSDDQTTLVPDSTNNYNSHKRAHSVKESNSNVFGSGLATVPRNYHHHHNHPENKKSSNKQLDWTRGSYIKEYQPETTTASSSDRYSKTLATPKRQNNINNNSNYPTSGTLNLPSKPQQQHQHQPMNQSARHQAEGIHPTTNYSSRTLPRNYSSSSKHQLLQSHYRGGRSLNQPQPQINNVNTLPIAPARHQSQFNQPQQQQQHNLTGNEMRNPQQPHNNNSNNYNNPNCNVDQHRGTKSPLQQQIQHQFGNTISSLPSATEVVRSALSRSSSQVSLNQLNKTINLLPNSPPPYAPSPMTPTQQLKPATPSLSPSPVNQAYSSKTLGHQPARQSLLPGQTILTGTRTIGRPPQTTTTTTTGMNNQQRQHQPHQQQQQQQQQQPLYANPHASLMQHRVEQQQRQPNKNAASIREFNELDSLLRSLSPGSSTVTTHITPGYSARPGQPTFGGYMSSQHQQQQHQQPKPAADIYARVQKQGPAGPNINQYQPQAHQTQPIHTTTSQPYTIDVTNKKHEDENSCVRQQKLRQQDISEFEPPIEILPSMEDYQNIGKLNPVKNHYWYKPNMGRLEAVSLLKDKPQGTFIVRDSTSYGGSYGLAVRVSKLPKNILNNVNLRMSSNGDISDEYIRHFLIEPVASGGVRLKGYADEPVFDNLPDLIYQHSLTEIALPCKLVIPRADIEDPKFNHKQKQFFDDFIASKEQAKHQPYERTDPDGGYRKYPGDVYIHNEHRITFE